MKQLHNINDVKPKIENPVESMREKSILIIDDEEIIQNILTEVLGLMGFNTISAGSGVEGIDIFKKNKDKIELILLDMFMPGKSGLDTSRELSSVDPNIKIIFMSGFPDEDGLSNEENQDQNSFLKKPFSIEELSLKVQKMIS